MTEPAIVCPHCGSAAVVPLPGLGDKLSSVFSLTWRKPGKDLSFNNPELAAQFHAGAITAICTACRKRFGRAAGSAEAAAAKAPAPARPVAARLRELDQLRGEGLIDDAEYRAKRAEILRDL